jgi:hypothetical protein
LQLLCYSQLYKTVRSYFSRNMPKVSFEVFTNLVYRLNGIKLFITIPCASPFADEIPITCLTTLFPFFQ